MINKHLSDEEIQEYVLYKTALPENYIEHIETCESCKTKAANYKLLFAEISQQPASSFTFNLSGLVLQQLPQSKPRNRFENFVVYFPAFVAVAAVAFGAYFFRKRIENIFAGITVVFMYVMIIATVIIVTLKSIDMYKKYHQKISMLDF